MIKIGINVSSKYQGRGMKINIVFLLFLLNTFLSSNLHANQNSKQVIDSYDASRYYPQDYGLRDMTFKVKIDGLQKTLVDNINLGKIKDLHFLVHWTYPGTWNVEVKGIADSFGELISRLKILVMNHISIIKFDKLEKYEDNYTFLAKKVGTETKLYGTTRKDSQANTEVILTFAKDGKLKGIFSRGIKGSQDSSLDSLIMPWSKGKWVLNKVSTKSKYGRVETITDQVIGYAQVGDFGLPREIRVNTIQKVNGTVQKRRSKSTTIRFGNYIINQGKTRKILVR